MLLPPRLVQSRYAEPRSLRGGNRMQRIVRRDRRTDEQRAFHIAGVEELERHVATAHAHAIRHGEMWRRDVGTRALIEQALDRVDVRYACV